MDLNYSFRVGIVKKHKHYLYMKLEKYKIIRLLGRGGTGDVFLAEDISLGKFWAIKAVRKGRARYFGGFELMKELDHPGIPRIVEKCEDNEFIYYIMDYVPGTTLSEYIKRYGQSEELAYDIGMQICDILKYLHGTGRNVIFRDLKLSNLMITDEGRIKLIDFDFARALPEGKKSGYSRKVVTKGYSPPEQYRGMYCVESDIYALGRILEKTAGKTCGRGLKKVIRRAVRPEITKRFHSSGEMRSALEKMNNENKNHRLRRLAILAVFFFLVFLVQLRGITDDAMELSYITAIRNGDYSRAIEIHPENPENYKEFFKKYCLNGDRERGAAVVKEYLRVYSEELSADDKRKVEEYMLNAE